MTTITIDRALLEQALNALLLPCDRWNKQQFLIVKGAIESLNAALAAPATAPEQMPLERDCICHQDLHIDGYSGGAAPEGLYGALWVVVEGVGKKYVLADQSSEPKDMPAPATAPDDRVKELKAELAATEIAIAEYRQQCLDNATEIARLRSESEERLQNCAALVAENEQLRWAVKDALAQLQRGDFADAESTLSVTAMKETP